MIYLFLVLILFVLGTMIYLAIEDYRLFKWAKDVEKKTGVSITLP